MTNDEQKIINKTENYVKEKLMGEGSGHDWWHVYRVWQNAKTLAKYESGDIFVVELAALLHDVADWKFHGGDETVGPRVSRKWLEGLEVEEEVIIQVEEIIGNLSFKGAGVDTSMKTIEGMSVQDADRLDALGAIGIGRAFAYGGYKEREMYNPNVKPAYHQTFEDYKKNEGTTINHFYEKLLLLKELMNTKHGKKMAEERHQFMEDYLKQFFREWQGL